MKAKLVVGDTGTVLVANCRSEETGAIVPGLASATATLKYRIDSGELKTRQMTIRDADAGEVVYQFLAGDLTPGAFEGEIEITDASNKLLSTVDTFHLTVRKKV